MTDKESVQINVVSGERSESQRESAVESSIVVPDHVGDRYASYKLISWWKQDLLQNATAMVVGAGALGNEVLKNLALLGLGRILIVDFDIVEQGNLSRSVLFRASDSGRSKAAIAAEVVKDLNPDVEVQAFHGDVTTDLGLGAFRRMDLIIGCLDSREARLALNSCAYRVGKPWIDGAIQELLGVARVFWPGRGACYECTLTPADWEIINLRYSCTLLAREQLLEGKIPTTPTIASIIAAIQSQDALKILHGIEIEPGRGFVFNGLTNYAYTVTYPRKDGCMGHDVTYYPVEELPECRARSTTLREMLEIARQHLGLTAQIELDYELVTEFQCPICGNREPVFEPLRRLDGLRAQCPDCGQQRNGVTTHAVTGQETYLDRKLAEVGIPDLHIVSARSGRQWGYFELSGDVQSFFDWC